MEGHTPEARVSHLWGTFHTPDPLLLDLPQPFLDILRTARVVALEFDPVPDTAADAAANADVTWMWAMSGADRLDVSSPRHPRLDRRPPCGHRLGGGLS